MGIVCLRPARTAWLGRRCPMPVAVRGQMTFDGLPCNLWGFLPDDAPTTAVAIRQRHQSRDRVRDRPRGSPLNVRRAAPDFISGRLTTQTAQKWAERVFRSVDSRTAIRYARRGGPHALDFPDLIDLSIPREVEL